jgi:hypothetical protein
MRPPKKNDLGFYFPLCAEQKHHSADGELSAMVVAVNDDDTLNLVVWDECGNVSRQLNVPTEENADDGVHFFRMREPEPTGTQ